MLQEWSGNGCVANVLTGGPIASWTDLLDLRIRLAKGIYPWWTGPTQSHGIRASHLSRCPPCPLRSVVGKSWCSWTPEMRSKVALVNACCPPGRHLHTPDAVYLKRNLLFTHESGVKLCFDPEDAVRGCMIDAVGDDFAPLHAMPRKVQVQHAKQWNRNNQRKQDNMLVQKVKWAYDWTFSTRWWRLNLFCFHSWINLRRFR